MTATHDFFLSDCQDQRSVHRQSDNRRSTGRGQRHDLRVDPAKVGTPNVGSRVEQQRFPSRDRIDTMLLRRFSQRAGNACQGQIALLRFTTGDSRQDMIDMKRRFLARLR